MLLANLTGIYLLIDCHQLTSENLRLRTNILPAERQIAYLKSTRDGAERCHFNHVEAHEKKSALPSSFG